MLLVYARFASKDAPSAVGRVKKNAGDAILQEDTLGCLERIVGKLLVFVLTFTCWMDIMMRIGTVCPVFLVLIL